MAVINTGPLPRHISTYKPAQTRLCKQGGVDPEQGPQWGGGKERKRDEDRDGWMDGGRESCG